MFDIDGEKTIHITRGDVGCISVGATIDGEVYTFKKTDVVRFKVFRKKECDDVILQKDVVVLEDSDAVDIDLSKEDTKIGELIVKPIDYWYEIELNPETHPQTIIGYDEDGAKIFKLYPEGGDV